MIEVMPSDKAMIKNVVETVDETIDDRFAFIKTEKQDPGKICRSYLEVKLSTLSAVNLEGDSVCSECGETSK